MEEAALVVGNMLFRCLASVQASLMVGAASLIVLWRLNYLRLPSGAINVKRIALVPLQAAAVYTYLICIVFHLFTFETLSDTIRDGFGNDRMNWLFIGSLLDIGARLVNEFRHGDG